VVAIVIVVFVLEVVDALVVVLLLKFVVLSDTLYAIANVPDAVVLVALVFVVTEVLLVELVEVEVEVVLVAVVVVLVVVVVLLVVDVVLVDVGIRVVVVEVVVVKGKRLLCHTSLLPKTAPPMMTTLPSPNTSLMKAPRPLQAQAGFKRNHVFPESALLHTSLHLPPVHIMLNPPSNKTLLSITTAA
jgi:hypothetical protein